MPVVYVRSWDEAKHPRDPRGRFASGMTSDRLSELFGQQPQSFFITDWQPLGGGNVALSVELVTFRDGSQAIDKKTATVEEAHTEFLASKVGEAIGAPVAATALQPGDRGVFMEYVAGKTGDEVRREPDGGQALVAAYRSDAGKRLGLLDALVNNTDRHRGNWIMRGGQPVGIDHGGSMIGDVEFRDRNGNALPDNYVTSSKFASGQGGWIKPTKPAAWADNDLSPTEVAELRSSLTALRPEFEALGRGDWHDAMMQRFAGIASHAKGVD